MARNRKNRKPEMHASLREETAWILEPARREPTHHTTHVYRRSRLMAGEGMLPVNVRGDGSERPPSDYVGRTLNTDRNGHPNYGGGRQVKATASDEVARRRAAMGNATRDGLVKLASW
jgi:hypothetical protein